ERLSESGYFRAKIAQEKLIQGSSIPYSIVHATQFFEFLKGLADISFDGNKVRLPDVLFQPMAADDVAEAVGRIAVGAPVNGIVEVAGPEQFRVDDLVRRRLAALQDPREVIADPNARYSGAKISERTLVPGNNARLGATRFETWLTQSTPHAAQYNDALNGVDQPKGQIYDVHKTDFRAGMSHVPHAGGTAGPGNAAHVERPDKPSRQRRADDYRGVSSGQFGPNPSPQCTCVCLCAGRLNRDAGERRKGNASDTWPDLL